jgi:beta-lactamase regulating signal transducer with metallopeptidase domain
MLTYFLQVNLCWLLFYGLYYALLSRETFFKLNRIYLIISLLCGLVIPLSISRVEILTESPIIEIIQPIAISVVEFQQNIESNIVETQAETWSVWTVLTWVYGLGIAVFLLKFSIGLYKIFQLYKQGEKHKNKDFKLINTEWVKTPFSFFNWIFINDKITENLDFQQIIAHEKAHVQQKHSFDIVGLEILRGVFWLSPLVHLYARSLRNVHEYLADAAALQNTEKKQYGRLLISQTVCANGLALVNHFNFSQLKKRIIMMTRNRSQRIVLMKYTLAAPIFLLLVVAFTIPNSPLMSHTEGVSREVENAVNTVETTLKNAAQPADNQDLKTNERPRVSIKGTQMVYVLAKNADHVTALEINEGFEILSFKMIVQESDGYPATETYFNKGSVFEKKLKDRIKQSKPRSYFHIIEIQIKDLKKGFEYNYGDEYLHIVDEIPTDHLVRVVEMGAESSDNQRVGTPVSGNLPNNLLVKIEHGGAGGKMNFENFKGENLLKVYQFGQKPNISWAVKEFKVQRVTPTGQSEQIRNIGGTFNKEVKTLINQAQAGDLFHFIDIEVLSSDKTMVGNWGTLSFTLHENYRYGIPVLSFNNSSGLISKQIMQLLGTSGGLLMGGYKKYRMQSFNTNHFQNGQKTPTVIKNEGILFSEQAKALFDRLEVGDVLVFDNIKITDLDGSAINVEDIVKVTIAEPKVQSSSKKSVIDPTSDPMPRLAGRSNGLISLETFRNQFMLSLVQPHSAQPVYCAIQSFIVVRKPNGKSEAEYRQANNTGAKFNTEVLNLIQAAQNGDKYEFINIKGRCPGDVSARKLTDIAFTIGENKEDALRNELGASYMMNVENAKNASGDCVWKEGDTGEMPVFPGGEAEVSKFVYSNLRYPEECKKAGREAMFIINYVVSEEGYVTNVKNWKFKWANPHIEPAHSMVKMEAEDQPMVDEALRVIRSMPRWKPGTTNGAITCHRKSFMFKFKLP